MSPARPSKFCVQVTARTNIANDISPKFVVRDSTQVATRISQTGRTATFTVASGGRLGYVTGEDSVEVANPPTTCTHQCQAQNQVRGRLVVLGFPFPVPAASRSDPMMMAEFRPQCRQPPLPSPTWRRERGHCRMHGITARCVVLHSVAGLFTIVIDRTGSSVMNSYLECLDEIPHEWLIGPGNGWAPSSPSSEWPFGDLERIARSIAGARAGDRR